MAKSFKPPESVRNNAKRGLEFREKYGRGGLTTGEAGKEGIGSGVARARDLANGKGISLDTIRRMVNFFNRHEKNKDTPPEKGNGKIAWLLWGGDSGRRWAESILKQEGKETKSLHQAQTYKAGNTGAMICFFPGYNFAEDLAIPGASESPDDLHLTLAYLGEAKDIEHPERILDFVASLAFMSPPIRGKLNGIARFVGTDNENDPAVCLYDSPALPQFRQDLVNGLKGAGIYPIENHGFIPHITLDYIPPEKPMDYTVAPLPLNFYAVWVVLGETRFEYELTGENMSGEWVKRTLTSEPLAVTGLTIMESIVALQGEEDEVLGLFVKGDQFYVSVGDWITQATLDAVMEVLPGVEVEAEAPPPGDGWTQLWPPVMAAKAGARNSRIDLRRIQAVHDLMCELGAECKKPESYPMKSAANGESKNLSSQNYAGLIGLSQAMVKKK